MRLPCHALSNRTPILPPPPLPCHHYPRYNHYHHYYRYILEHDNGSRAVVDTVTATCTSWKLADGTEMVKQGAGTAHYLNGAALKGEFVPEERAKKVSLLTLYDDITLLPLLVWP